MNSSQNSSDEIYNYEEYDEYRDYDAEEIAYCLGLVGEWKCDVYCWVERFFLLFSTATFPLYLLFMFILIRYHKELNSSFFSICISLGFADILYTLSKYCFQILPKMFWYEDLLLNYYLPTMSKIGHWGIYFSQIFGVVLITLNRFSAIVFPMEYNAIWTSKRLALGIVLQWVLPLPLVAPMCVGMVLLSMDSISSESDIWNTWSKFLSYYTCFYNVQMWDEKTDNMYYRFALVFEPCLVLIIILMHIIMIMKQIQYNKKVKPRNRLSSTATQQRNKREIKLAVIGFIITMLYSGGVLCIALSYFKIQSQFASSAYYWFSDLFTSSNPFLLLLFSSKVRLQFKKVLCFWKKDDAFSTHHSYISDNTSKASPRNRETNQLFNVQNFNNRSPSQMRKLSENLSTAGTNDTRVRMNYVHSVN